MIIETDLGAGANEYQPQKTRVTSGGTGFQSVPGVTKSGARVVLTGRHVGMQETRRDVWKGSPGINAVEPQQSKALPSIP